MLNQYVLASGYESQYFHFHESCCNALLASCLSVSPICTPFLSAAMLWLPGLYLFLQSVEFAVDGFRKCEKWQRQDIVESKETKTSSWFNRFIGRPKKPEMTWPFPFSEGKMFVLTIQPGVEGYHINVGGRHVASFPHRMVNSVPLPKHLFHYRDIMRFWQRNHWAHPFYCHCLSGICS